MFVKEGSESTEIWRLALVEEDGYVSLYLNGKSFIDFENEDGSVNVHKETLPLGVHIYDEKGNFLEYKEAT